jgi:hypothetical protein
MAIMASIEANGVMAIINGMKISMKWRKMKMAKENEIKYGMAA